MTDPVAIYLQNHEAAAQAGLDLFRRVAAAQSDRSYGSDLAELRDAVAEDLQALHTIMGERGVRPAMVLAVALKVGERLSRLKPNGGLLTRMPLSDLIEVEGLADAVHAKESGWRALIAAKVDPQTELQRLLQRAQDQAGRLHQLHAEVAARVL
jgi:hypothetical protein